MDLMPESDDPMLLNKAFVATCFETPILLCDFVVAFLGCELVLE
jgi:hypothetical protein